MTFAELLQYLDSNTPFGILDGSAAQTIEKARAGTHANPIAAEIISAAIAHCGIENPEHALTRVEFVNSLAKLRLKYMADDAPVEGFRTVEKVITVADAAYNEEALREKGR